MKEILSQIENIVETQNGLGTDIRIEDRSFTIQKENFTTVSPEEATISFIDGGNQELFSTSTFEIQKIRIATVTYEGIDRKNIEKDTYYLLIKEDEMILEGDEIKTIEISEDVEDTVRKTLEYKKAVQKTNESDLVVIDGTITPRNIDSSLYKKLTKKPNIVGVAKATTARNTDGLPASYVFSRYTKQEGISKPYVYEALHHDITTSFFSTYKNRVFRVDATQNHNVSNLLPHTKDPVMPGYPYGLIDVDEQARVTNWEVDQERVSIQQRVGFETFQDLEESGNIHDLLDTKRF